jgi:hypothetical protein
MLDYLGKALHWTYYEFWRDPVPVDWVELMQDLQPEITDRDKKDL